MFINLLKTIIQIVFFWSLFLWIIPYWIFKIEYYHFRIYPFVLSLKNQGTLGMAIFLIASIFGLVSGYIMSTRGVGTPLPLDCTQKLVIQGPYRFVRNPMAVAGIMQGIAVGIFYGSYSIIVYSLLGAVIWDVFVRPKEEKDLLKRFGPEYEDYKSHVNCWVPTFSYIPKKNHE